MTETSPVRRVSRPRRPIIRLTAVAVAVLLGVIGHHALTSFSSSASSVRTLLVDHAGAVGEADGVVPDGTTVFDNDVPAVANLDPELLGALRRAATDAAQDGVVFYVNSGWRSVAYQEQLLGEAVAKYGSEQEAAKWVATPSTSAHVSGAAVDLAGSAATTWLSDHGSRHGLCQIYRNEPWHYELRTDAIHGGCPAMYPDAAHDPRLQVIGPASPDQGRDQHRR